MKKLLTILLCLFAFNVQADTMCQITRVIDGDTVDAICDSKKIRIRMLKIDSYESKRNTRAYKQAYIQSINIDEIVQRGHQATLITKQTLEGKTVQLVTLPKNSIDLYGRTLGELFIDGVSINDKLLKENPDVFLKY